MSATDSASAGMAVQNEGLFRRFLRATEIDSRIIGMVIALAVIWVGFHLAGPFFTGQALFLTPRNLWNLLTQTASISVMASGMVLIIVMRHIDLSVGSMLGFIAVVMAWLQVYGLTPYFEFGSPWIWIIATIVGLALGALIGCMHGVLVAYSGIPSFIVTLGGLLFWRGAAFKVASGETIAPMDPVYALIGGGPYGAVGSFWSWIIGAIACAGIIWSLNSGRLARKRFKFPLRPMWAEMLVGGILCGLVLATVYLVNIYYWPKGIVKEYATANAITTPLDEIFIAHGFAIPVLIALAVGLVMTFVANRTRLGRYVYRDRRQPRGGGAGGRQHQAHHHRGFHDHGPPRRGLRDHCDRPPQRRGECARHHR